ncbi:MAG TPA: sugar phosphate isomerase/epimerase family protein [Verrucomicrobiae bacterium]|nr:sugar phosphate isomerase/epimerase family protein [Verrucomicrobiae bacterium]
MTPDISRRSFLKTSAVGSVGLLAWGGGAHARGASTTKLRKAMIRKKPTEAELQELKAAGFDGVEGGIVTVEEASECRRIAERLGMRIHSVLRGWAEFNSDDPVKVQNSLKVSEDALRVAQAFGADAMLLVPCRIGGKEMKMPQPWEFEIEFDEKTGHISRVVAGDNTPYGDYIAAHNKATDASVANVRKLIPLAKQLKVVIALENVWNNLWVKPAIFKNFVASFQDEWVKAYFDIGNHLKYQKPEDWIRALGPLMAKGHIKDFKLDRAQPNGGKFVHPRDGDINWPEVRKALDEIGYSGWLTIEDGGLPSGEFSRRLDLIIAGE